VISSAQLDDDSRMCQMMTAAQLHRPSQLGSCPSGRAGAHSSYPPSWQLFKWATAIKCTIKRGKRTGPSAAVVLCVAAWYRYHVLRLGHLRCSGSRPSGQQDLLLFSECKEAAVHCPTSTILLLLPLHIVPSLPVFTHLSMAEGLCDGLRQAGLLSHHQHRSPYCLAAAAAAVSSSVA